MQRATDAYAAGHTSEAMALIREELAHPDPSLSASDRAPTQLNAIVVLGDLIELGGIDSQIDAEAARYRSDAEVGARAFSPDAQKTFAAQLDYAWGVFQLRAGRPGEALALLRRVEQAWEAGAESHLFDRIRILGEMAAAHQALEHRSG